MTNSQKDLPVRLVQYIAIDGSRHVGRVSADGNQLHPLSNTASVRELAEDAIGRGVLARHLD